MSFRDTSSMRQMLWATVPVVLVVGAFILHLARDFSNTPRPTRIVLSPRKKADIRLAEANLKAQSALDARLKKLAAFFSRGQSGARDFAEETLSLSGKLALVKGTVGSGNHEKFLAEAFAKHVFSGDDIKREVDAAIKGFIIDLEDIESAMLVDLRVDLADGPKQDLPAHLRSDEAFKTEYERFRVQAVKKLNANMSVTIARETGLFVASDLAAQVGLRVVRFVAAELGVEAGILGAGAASSVATLGIGLIAAVILDAVLDAVFRAAGYDPAGEIAGKVKASISNVQKVMIDGKGGLRHEMQKLNTARAALRQEIVNNLIEGGKR